ncbi:DNA topoisomerase IV subunit A [Mammaliicoccus sciuri]|uniref:DNA topoisomerase IV subunit A n=1 Tax=Mammaliicoccus sciuri TaxID=1296 RepID=UPI0018B0C6BA|nr:DNA topoisomerase IV subunit A [Mammaliicoccus sciuri]MBF9296731.1 DNA topoisomerase IV subunit A [Staphylococcus schleiferi]MCJ0939406.1 DNA topoisomerase IV subunit A [Mammaliicoccus sciuri]MCJ0942140.1 DNA topoisomerase IV subunit A [Mammaliicoccus sciuri]MCJ0964550.1 DNA topoisomerase IV subunit A [Mammaliicoccus sciuri]MDO0947894.1 DNA topoisomerase IV subunit A [Mammaliicoccus sciuri]
MVEQIQNLPLEDVIGDRFGRYSKYIIQDRALPDVRDGLKPVQRRILFAMYKDGNTYDRNFRKSAKTVGNVIGNYHPHGDSSVYDAMVRMSQDWKLRHVLIEMHGNNGSIDNDPPAAMRYTEAKLSKLAEVLLQDIDKETVEHVQNFDDTAMEPMVLPARYPNLLVNGSTGISAGYATDIPPHNLGEVIDATLKLIDKPSASVDELIEHIKGPDFPTGGIIQGLDGIKKAYKTGKGKIVVRSKVEIEKIRGGREQIVVTEVPFEVNKGTLVKKIDELRADKKIEGIVEVRDETDREGLRIAIELKKDINSEGVLNYLYKNTDLQVLYHFNMVAINNRRPELLGLKQILESYIEHQKEVVTRRSQYELSQAQKRMHIVEGLIKALSILDEVIETIRASKNKRDAKENLIAKFEFTEEQAEAIVMLQLYRLTNTDIVSLENEFDELKQTIERLKDILQNEKSLFKVIKNELRAVRKEFADERITEIEEKIEEIKIEKEILVPSEETIVSVTHDGYIKRTSNRSYIASGVEEVGLKDGDYLLMHEKMNTQDTLIVFTNKGNYLFIPVHEIVDLKWKDLGKHISQMIPIDDDERVISVNKETDFKPSSNYIIATKNGMIKKSTNDKFKASRITKPLVAIKLKGDDEVVSVLKIVNDELITVITEKGMSLTYDTDELSDIGLKAAGVKSINLKDNDKVVMTDKLPNDQSVFIVTDRGSVKRMKAEQFVPAKRSQRGLMILKELKSKAHRIVFARTVSEDETCVIISEKDQVKVNTKDFNFSERYTNGRFVVDENDFGQVIDAYFEEKSID